MAVLQVERTDLTLFAGGIDGVALDIQRQTQTQRHLGATDGFAPDLLDLQGLRERDQLDRTVRVLVLGAGGHEGQQQNRQNATHDESVPLGNGLAVTGVLDAAPARSLIFRSSRSLAACAGPMAARAARYSRNACHLVALGEIGIAAHFREASLRRRPGRPCPGSSAPHPGGSAPPAPAPDATAPPAPAPHHVE